jgi:hypothetical protein
MQAFYLLPFLALFCLMEGFARAQNPLCQRLAGCLPKKLITEMGTLDCELDGGELPVAPSWSNYYPS